jgi:FkbM family methyltransferase
MSLKAFRTLIASRRLFNNWLSAGLKYFLIKHKLQKGDITVKCNDRSFRLPPKIYSWLANAWHDNVIRNFSCSDLISCDLYDACKIVIDNKGTFLKTPDGILLHLDENNPNSVIFTVVETWLYDIHFLDFDLSDWLVIDVGAFIGDTALYYAKRGAIVVAVEPVPSNYQAMLRNLELNPNLKQKILPVNAAVAGVDGYVDITYESPVDGSATIYGKGRHVARVRSLTLKNLLNQVNLDLNMFKVKALKMDCKGCEYDVIFNETEVLKLFDIVKIEYSGYLRNRTVHEILSVLEKAGFKCRIWAHNNLALMIGLDKHGTLTGIK